MYRKSSSGRKNRRFLIISFAVIAAAVTLLLTALHIWETRSSFFTVETSDNAEHYEKRLTLEVDGKEYKLKRNLTTLLLIGLDKTDAYVREENSYRNTQQADFLLLLVVDGKERVCSAIHINRDTMAQMQILGIGGKAAGTDTAQISLSHTYGSGKEDSAENTAKAVSDALFGFPVDHYLTFTLDAVPAVNDALGGVTVTVEDDFTGIDDTLVQGKPVTLYGEHALHFVRTRMGLEDSSNLRRMERQREYLNAFLETARAKAETDSNLAIECLNAVSPYMLTDCSGEWLFSFLDDVRTYQSNDILTLPGSTQFGEPILGTRYTEFYLDEEGAKQLLAENFFQ